MLPGFNKAAFNQGAFADSYQGTREAVLPGDVTIGGTVYHCAARLGEKGLQPLETGGYFERQELRVWIPKSRLPTPPAVKSSITYAGETFIVEGIDHAEAVFTDWLIRAGKNS